MTYYRVPVLFELFDNTHSKLFEFYSSSGHALVLKFYYVIGELINYLNLDLYENLSSCYGYMVRC